MTTLLMINVIGLTLGAWAVLFRVFPAYATTRCRNRLWRLRDRLSDDIRHSRFDDATGAKKLVAFIDLGIEDAEDITAFNTALFYRIFRDEKPEDDPFDLELGGEDARRLQPMARDFESALLAKALLGSPSGWFLIPILAPIVAIAVIRDTGRPAVLDEAANQIGNDLLLSNCLDEPHDSLYQHV